MLLPFQTSHFPSVVFTTSPLLTLTHLASVISLHLPCSFFCLPLTAPSCLLRCLGSASTSLFHLRWGPSSRVRIACEAEGEVDMSQLSEVTGLSCLLCNLSRIIFELKPIHCLTHLHVNMSLMLHKLMQDAVSLFFKSPFTNIFAIVL